MAGNDTLAASAVVLAVVALGGCGSSDNGVASEKPGTGGSTSGGGSGGGSASGGTGGSGGSGATGGSGGSGGIILPDGGDPTADTDGDDIPDGEEGDGDYDNDGKKNVDDPINDGPPAAIKLTQISTTFNSPIGIDYHEPTNSVVVSVNYPSGTPSGFERIEQNGDHQQFSSLSGLTEEVKIATARSKNPAGFEVGDLFVGNGVDGQIVRITQNGGSVVNPWVDLPGDANGLMRGSLYVDRTGVWGGDLVAVTTSGEVWRVTVAGAPTKVATVGVHLEGAVTVPDKPARFGPIAGKLLAGSENEGKLYAFSLDGTFATYEVGVQIEDIDIIKPKENFFGVNFGTSSILGAGAEQWHSMLGDVLLAQEAVASGTSGIYRLKFDGAGLVAEAIGLTADSAVPGQWEHVTFAAAGIVEIPPVPQ